MKKDYQRKAASAATTEFVAATETALAEMIAADLSELDLVGLMVDGVHFADHLCLVALGIGIDGTKHPLGLVEGDTENATVVTRPVGRAPRPRPRCHQAHPGGHRRRQSVGGLGEVVFDQPVIARCQLHKIRNVQRRLNDAMGATAATKDARRLRQP